MRDGKAEEVGRLKSRLSIWLFYSDLILLDFFFYNLGELGKGGEKLRGEEGKG